MIWHPLLWRTALRVREAYRAARTQQPPPAKLELSRVQDRFLLLELVTGREWQSAARRTRTLLLVELERLEYQLRETLTRLRNEREAILPTARFLYEELLAVAEEFDGIAVAGREVIVTTDAIVLEDISLGRFAIHLEIERLGTDAPFRIEALEPNPASSSTSTTHPHVHDERLCAGEGRAALTAALAAGHLYDFFLIVDRILHTYAEGAAYVELAEWHGIPCHDCAVAVAPDDVYVCNDCDESLCSNCSLSCPRCGNGYCGQCLDRCARCDEPYCRGCLEDCGRCGEACCPDCLAETLCPSCTEEITDETSEEPVDEAS